MQKCSFLRITSHAKFAAGGNIILIHQPGQGRLAEKGALEKPRDGALSGTARAASVHGSLKLSVTTTTTPTDE